MCLVVFSYKENKKSSFGFPGSLVLAANRDEYYERPTESMHWWGRPDLILAGKDLQAGGTWFGISEDGRFAVITNHKELHETELNLKSRGELVSNYAISTGLSAKEYIQDIKQTSYAGFNLLLGDNEGIHYFSNRKRGNNKIGSGIHVMGNLLLNSKSKKSFKAKDGFKKLLQTNPNEETLIKFMESDSGNLSNLGMAGFKMIEHEEIPYRFIRSDVYGTRCTTILTIDLKGNYRVTEQAFSQKGNKIEKVFYQINP